jgi:LysM repeat protein
VVVHLVRPGDTVSAIATRYRITVKAILAANRLGANGTIHPGQKLRLPGVAPAAPTPKPAPPPSHPYTVKAGDTLVSICAKEKVTLAAVLGLNRITNAGVIHPGQKLLLPGAPKSTVPNTFLGRRYPDAVAQAAAMNRAALAKRDLPTRAEMRAIVTQTARSMGVDPSLALAIAWQESGFNPRVVSPANAIGTMQVIPGTGRWASALVGRRLDLLVPKDNATAGVAVLAALLAQAEEDQAIAGYYQGLGSVRSRGMYEDTKSYVGSVKAHRDRFAKELAAK